MSLTRQPHRYQSTDQLYLCLLTQPAYDVLPSGQALGFQQMRVGEDEADSTLANALSMAPMFALKQNAAIQQES